MDIITNNSTVKTPETEIDTPTRIQPIKPSPFTNGVLKRHAPLNHHHHPVVVTYKECLKNHAATRGGHALDGCGEFMPSPTSNPSEPSSLKCAACACHRNFHRRESDEPPLQLISPPNLIPALEYQPHNRHHPPPPGGGGGVVNSESSPNNSPSPPPISSAYYPSAPHMLLALSHVPSSAPPTDGSTPILTNSTLPLYNSSSNGRKRFRTKFTADQKEKMMELANRVGWKMQKRDDDLINGFCTAVGVDKGVFKVWMHNNKNNSGKKEHYNPAPQLLSNNNNINIAISTPPPPATAANGSSGINYGYQNGGNREVIKEIIHGPEITNNGSSSSS